MSSLIEYDGEGCFCLFTISAMANLPHVGGVVASFALCSLPPASQLKRITCFETSLTGHNEGVSFWHMTFFFMASLNSIDEVTRGLTLLVYWVRH